MKGKQKEKGKVAGDVQEKGEGERKRENRKGEC